MIIETAHAKINFTLSVGSKRADGYHSIDSLMHSISLSDRITLTKAEAITLSVTEGEAPLGRENLMVRAAERFFEETGLSGGVSMTLAKRIPSEAGMGGGSSDAAAVLRGLARLYETDLSLATLARWGASLGADIPFCVVAGAARCQGIGEKLTPLAPAPDCYVLVAKPDINVSTKYVYEHLDAQEIIKHPDIDGMVEAIAEESLQGILDRMENVLETVTVSAYPVIQTIKDRMKELGAINSLMSGSGPTVFGIFVEKDMARRAYDKLEEEQLAKQIFLTEFCE